MISKVLSKNQCKNCQFCCVFKKDSLWELPVFPKEKYERIIKQNKEASKYLDIVDDTYARMRLEEFYSGDNPEETVSCLFLDENSGCMLNNDDKPLECRIWPLRVMDKDGKLVLVFETICPELGEVPSDELIKLVEEDIGETIEEYAKKYPYIAKPYDEKFPIIKEFD